MADRLPFLVGWLVDRWVGPEHREFLLGDLEEAMHERRETQSPLRAWLWAHGQALRSVLPLRLRRAKPLVASPAELLRGLWNDVRLAARFHRRRPAFLAIVTLTLALGIGATTTIFSVVDAALFRPLPWDRAEQLVAVRSLADDNEEWLISYLDVESLRASARKLIALGAWRNEQLNLTGMGAPERLTAVAIDHQLFALLGVEPMIGRLFEPADDQAGSTLTAVLGYGLWQRRFGGDPTVLGRAVNLHGVPYVVIGVMAPDKGFPSADTELWIPAAQRPGVRARGLTNWFVLGRRAEGVELAALNQEVAAIGRRLALAHPDENGGRTFIAHPYRQSEVGSAERPLELLLGAVLAVLLIACVNVANMLLARAAQRRSDLAIRRALGATRGRLLRTFLAENMMVTGLGGCCGVLLAYAALPLVLAWSPQGVAGLERVSLDHRVLGLAVVLTFACGVLFAIVELIDARGRSTAGALKPAARTVVRGGRLRGALVVAEVALAVVLVVGAGLLLKTLWRLSMVEPGFRSERVLAVDIELPRDFISDEWAINVDFFETLALRAAALPGVAAATLAYQHPLDTGWRNGFEIARREAPEQDDWSASYRPVRPDFFDAMGIPLLAGRYLEASDRADRPGAVVVNRAFVQRFLADGNGLGETLLMPGWWGDATPSRFQIVGVVGDVRFAGLDLPAEAAMYFPHAQTPVNPMTLLIRAEDDPLAMVEPIRSLVADLDPHLPLGEVEILGGQLGESLGSRLFVSRLLGAFAGLALALAAIGLYGVLSFAVASRRREIGVRGALGARAIDLSRMVLGLGLGLTVAGLVVGAVGALALSRLLGGLLFGVGPADPTTFAGVALTLLAVAGVACLAPLRQALAVEPSEVLRQE